MPKTRRDRSVSYDSSRRSPVPCSSSHGRILSSASSFQETKEIIVKEWEEARCPVCMEHPHNALLLVCSSYVKGCRPYMCDTSYRHSNCFDQFCKSFAETSSEAPSQETNFFPSETATQNHAINSGEILMGPQYEEQSNKDTMLSADLPNMRELPQKLVCPLCRGQILGCTVVESARGFMNAKARNCASESCEYSGTYSDLRKHARLEHPLVRPSEADPERQRNWRRMERQRDIGDVLSTIQSSLLEDRVDDLDENSIMPIDDDRERGWLTVLFLVFRPGGGSRSSSSSSLVGASRPRALVGVRRRPVRLWGEGYDEGPTLASLRDAANGNLESSTTTRRSSRNRAVEDDGEANAPAARDADNVSSDGGSGPWRRRLRRRTTPNNQL